MCLVVKYGCDIEIAQSDIKVYKLVEKHCDYWDPVYISGYKHFKYGEPIAPLNSCFHPIKNLEIYHYRYLDQICEGFHSRVTKHEYVTNTICIIPKGSEICYGDSDDIVSNQLIVFKNYFQYLMYKLKKIL